MAILIIASKFWFTFPQHSLTNEIKVGYNIDAIFKKSETETKSRKFFTHTHVFERIQFQVCRGLIRWVFNSFSFSFKQVKPLA